MRPATLLLALGVLGLAYPAPAPAQPSTFLGKGASAWQKQLNDRRANTAQRRAAAFALGRFGAAGYRAVPDLTRWLKGDVDAGLRAAAAAAVGDVVLDMTPAAKGRAWAEAGDALTQALKGDADPLVRRGAAYALGAFGPLASDAVPALKKALKLRTPKGRADMVRQNAAWALGRVRQGVDGEVVADICDLLTDENPLVRRDAAAALGALGRRLPSTGARDAAGKAAAEGAVKPLIELAAGKGEDAVVRRTALDALAILAGPEHREHGPELYPLLESKDAETARAAAFALAGMGGEPAAKAVGALVKALADKDPTVQALAATGLGSIGPAAVEAADDLAEALDGKRDPVVRRNAAIALGLVCGAEVGKTARDDVPESAVKALAKAMDPKSGAKHAMVRVYAADALGMIRYPNNKAALPAIAARLKDRRDNYDVRHRCVWALFDVPKEQLVEHKFDEVLGEVLGEKSLEHIMVRYDAARALAHILEGDAPDRTADVLLDMLRNKKLQVYKGSKGTIEGTGDESSKGATGVASDVGGDARFMAANALGFLGDKARKRKDVMQALREAAEDKEPTLSKSAAEALKRLGADD